MGEAKRTEGPWQIGKARGKGTGKRIWRNDEGPNGAVESNTNWACIAQYVHNDADARLIAAAPELLEALEEMLAYANGKIPFSIKSERAIEEKALAALAKAKAA